MRSRSRLRRRYGRSRGLFTELGAGVRQMLAAAEEKSAKLRAQRQAEQEQARIEEEKRRAEDARRNEELRVQIGRALR